VLRAGFRVSVNQAVFHLCSLSCGPQPPLMRTGGVSQSGGSLVGVFAPSPGHVAMAQAVTVAADLLGQGHPSRLSS